MLMLSHIYLSVCKQSTRTKMLQTHLYVKKWPFEGLLDFFLNEMSQGQYDPSPELLFVKFM
jgi:hypothetical protein